MNEVDFNLQCLIYGLINDLITEEKVEVLNYLNKNENWKDLLKLIN